MLLLQNESYYIILVILVFHISYEKTFGTSLPCCVFVQSDRYTVGGSDMFDTLTDLVDFYKRKGIEEISGNWVHLKQVDGTFSYIMNNSECVGPESISNLNVLI